VDTNVSEENAVSFLRVAVYRVRTGSGCVSRFKDGSHSNIREKERKWKQILSIGTANIKRPFSGPQYFFIRVRMRNYEKNYGLNINRN
jgi:hypothetical protein